VVAEQPQRIADMPPNLVQLLVQQQQTVQREHTNEELQQSPASGLPVPRFNTPSPDLNQTRSSIFSSVGKPPALSSGGSSRSSSSSLGCRPLPQSPLHSRQDSSDIPAQQQPTPPAPRRQLYWLPTASSSPVGPSFRLLTSSQSTTPSGQPAVSQSAPRLSALRQHSPILSAIRLPSPGLLPLRPPSSGLLPLRPPSSGLLPLRQPSSGQLPLRLPSSGQLPLRQPSSGL
jgi:hypothetical protein